MHGGADTPCEEWRLGVKKTQSEKASWKSDALPESQGDSLVPNEGSEGNKGANSSKPSEQGRKEALRRVSTLLARF